MFEYQLDVNPGQAVFEEIGLDLYVVLVLAAISIYLWWRHGSQPLFIYYGTAYVIGLFATLAVKVFGR